MKKTKSVHKKDTFREFFVTFFSWVYIRGADR